MSSSVVDNGYWMYRGLCEAPEFPSILTRTEKGQALTHLEMDVNLASLLHTVVTSSIGDSFTPEEHSAEIDIFNERRKPSREEEMAGLFATFSYAAVKHSGSDGEEILVQYPPVMLKIQHTTDEIRYKLSNETIPGTFGIEEDFHVSGSSFVDQDSYVSGNVIIQGTTDTNNLRVSGSASVDGDLYIVGNLYVNGVMFGNLSKQEYHPTVESRDTYAEPYERKDTYTREEVDQLLENLRGEILSKLEPPHEPAEEIYT